MGLYEGNTHVNDNKDRSKMKKIVLSAIIIICLLICILIAIIVYVSQQPKGLSLNLDGKVNNKLFAELKIKTDDSGNIELDKDGNPIIYAPIKKVAQYFGYDDNNGNYMTVSEDTNSCNVKNKNEVAIFTLDSNVIYKKDLTNNNSNYETYKIEEKVYKDTYKGNQELYTTKEGLEIAYNIYISYNKKTNSIDIYTLDYYITYLTTENAQTGKSKIKSWGYSKLDDKFVNQKAILNNMIVVKDASGIYGVVDLNGNKIFSTQYDSLTYIPESNAFLIESNQRFGIISAKGETKIKPVYKKLQLIDNAKQLYLVSDNNKYGVIDINSNIIVPLDYEKIGVSINQFSENNLTNGYIIQEELIPVQQDAKWGFYNLDGSLIGEGIVYETIGCITKSSQGTAYNVLSIPEYKSIVVRKEGKYGCVNLEGENTVSFIADDVYMQIASGEVKYIMSQTKNEQVYTKDIADLIK